MRAMMERARRFASWLEAVIFHRRNVARLRRQYAEEGHDTGHLTDEEIMLIPLRRAGWAARRAADGLKETAHAAQQFGAAIVWARIGLEVSRSSP